MALCAPGCGAELSLGGPLREEHTGLLLGSARGSAQLRTMPEANYLFSVSWGYIKVCLRGVLSQTGLLYIRVFSPCSQNCHIDFVVF